MINEIKRRLEGKEKVYIELVDPNGLRDRGDIQEYLIQDLLDNEKPRVLGVGLGTHSNLVKIRLDSSCRIVLIDESSMVFFEMVSEGKTFDDLIDVALQAGKDGVLIGVRVDFDDVRCLRVEYSSREHVDQIFDCHDDYSEYVERIKSRYTETFAIEVEEDCFRIRQGAEITFMNGNSVIMDNPPTDDGIVKIWNDGRYDFTVLKGATVTQRKSNK